jgi:hypothetical protein
VTAVVLLAAVLAVVLAVIVVVMLVYSLSSTMGTAGKPVMVLLKDILE